MIERIRGLKIVDASLAPEHAGLRFDNGASLSIYNDFVVLGAPAHADSVIGKTVIGIHEAEDMIALTLDGGVLIQVDMRDEAYNGPEALQLRVPGQPIVVWS